MKIAIISEGRTPVFGGGQVHVKFLCEGLIKQYGADVDLFVRKLKDEHGKKYDKDESLLGGKWKIIRTGRTAIFFNGFARLYRIISFSLYLIRKAKKEKYDIIHAHALMPGLPAMLAGWWNKIPVVYTVHGTMHLDVPKRDKYYYLEKFFVTWLKYDLEISVSEQILKYKNRNQNIQIIPNGVDLRKYDAFQVPYRYPGLTLLSVGRIDWQKNNKILVEVLAEIGKEELEKVGLKWNLVGDGHLRKELEQCIKELGLEQYIECKGPLFGDDLLREYKSSHVFVLPSLGEGQPLTILEAMASKLAIVATDVGDNKHFIKNGENGYLVEPGDKATLKEAIWKIIRMSKEEIAAMGECGYEFVQEYDRSKVVERTYGEYRKLINS